MTDTIPSDGRTDPIRDRLVVLSTDKLIGEAIHRIHHNASVSALFKLADYDDRPPPIAPPN